MVIQRNATLCFITCVEVKCTSPVTVPNAIRHHVVPGQPSYVYGSMVYYRCIDGYLFVGGMPKKSVTCRDDGRWYPDPTSLYCVGRYAVVRHNTLLYVRRYSLIINQIFFVHFRAAYWCKSAIRIIKNLKYF